MQNALPVRARFALRLHPVTRLTGPCGGAGLPALLPAERLYASPVSPRPSAPPSTTHPTYSRRVIAQQAANAGFTFSGVVDEFTGHELCSGSPWLNSVTVPVYESYHPKSAGQSGGYLPAFRSVA